MNKARRDELGRIKSVVESVLEDLQSVQDEEEECRDNIPESFVERYDHADEACNSLSEAVDRLQDAIDAIEQAIDQ